MTCLDSCQANLEFQVDSGIQTAIAATEAHSRLPTNRIECNVARKIGQFGRQGDASGTRKHPAAEVRTPQPQLNTERGPAQADL